MGKRYALTDGALSTISDPSQLVFLFFIGVTTPVALGRDHLFLGTQNDNIKDRVEKNRTASLLRPCDVIHAKRLLANGATHQNVAKLFGVHRHTISDIAYGNTWRRIVP